MTHLIKFLFKLLGETYSMSHPRADMFLPAWLLLFGVILVIGGMGAAVYALAALSFVGAFVALFCCLFGVAAILCWKNQKINIVSESSFEYSTFLGNKKVYYFSDIIGYKQSNDSVTLITKKGNIHIESVAIISDRLMGKLNAVMESIG